MQCLSLALRCHKNVKRPNECNNKLQSSSQRAIIDAFYQEPRVAHLGTIVGCPRISRHTAHFTCSTLHVDIDLQTPHPRQTLNPEPQTPVYTREPLTRDQVALGLPVFGRPFAPASGQKSQIGVQLNFVSLRLKCCAQTAAQVAVTAASNCFGLTVDVAAVAGEFSNPLTVDMRPQHGPQSNS